jgi:hypothetical protein
MYTLKQRTPYTEHDDSLVHRVRELRELLHLSLKDAVSSVKNNSTFNVEQPWSSSVYWYTEDKKSEVKNKLEEALNMALENSMYSVAKKIIEVMEHV